MVQRRVLALAVLAAVSKVSLGLRRQELGADICEADEVSFALITSATCTINWSLRGGTFAEGKPKWHEIQKVGCWELRGFNTDKFLSSTVYQNAKDGRCVLAFSGYHGALAGYTRGSAALVWPPQTWNLCGYDMYAPYVRLLRHHTSLGNWSKIMNLLAGPESTCKGELTFSAESMGGTAGEMLTACANDGGLHELMDSGLPNFTLQTLYTFGSPAGTVRPLSNNLREDGCFKGKRIYMAQDTIAHFGSIYGMQHPRMDAVEIWPGSFGERPSVRVAQCYSDAAMLDGEHAKPPPVATNLAWQAPLDPLNHEVVTYSRIIKWMQDAGEGSVFDAEPVKDTTAAKYLALLQKQ